MDHSLTGARRPARRRRRARGLDEVVPAPSLGGARLALAGPRHQTAAGERQAAALDLQRSLGNRHVARALLRRDTPDGGAVAAPPAADPTLHRGDEGGDVSHLQQLLNTVGASPRLDTDGKYGPLTAAAVQRFQQAHGLPTTGEADPETMRALTDAVAAAPDPMFGAETPRDEARDAVARARALFRAGRYAEALPLYERAYSLPELSMEERATPLFNMARCHQMLDNTDQAIALFQEYLLFPDAVGHADAREMLRRLRAGEAGPARLAEVEAPTPEEQAAIDQQARAALDAGHAASNGGDNDAAREQYQAAYNLRARDELRHEAAIALANTLRDGGDPEGAVSLWQEALSFPGVTDEERLILADSIRRARAGAAAEAADAAPLSPEQQELEGTLAYDAFEGGRYEQALERYGRLYAQPELRGTLLDRPTILYMMGLCHQRLEQYAEAIASFEESLLYPNNTEGSRQEALEHIRQCRMGEQESHVHLDGETVSEDETLLFTGEVYFETGRSDVGGLGNDTIRGVVDLLRERHASEPGLTFRISVVGGASSRWRGAEDQDASDRYNLALSAERAGNVETAIVAMLPPADIAGGIYAMSTDAMGDELSEALGLDPDDNTWRLRKVFISVWARQAAPATPGAGTQP